MNLQEKSNSNGVKRLKERTVWEVVELQLALMDGEEKEDKKEEHSLHGEQCKQRLEVDIHLVFAGQ